MTRTAFCRPRSILGALAVALVLFSGNPLAALEPEKTATSARLEAVGEQGAARLTVAFSGVPTFSARASHGGTRLIIDVPHSRVDGAPPALSEPTGLVLGVMVQGFEPKGQAATTRILLTLSEKAPYAVRAEGKNLVVRVAKSQAELDVERPITPVAGTQSAGSSEIRLGDVRFERHPQGHAVIVELDAAAAYQRREVSPKLTRLELEATVLPEELERALDVRAFGGVVHEVASYKRAGRVVVDVAHDETAESRVERRGTSLVWAFYAGSIPTTVTGVGLDGGAARRTKTIQPDPLSQLLESESEVTESVPEAVAGFAPVPLGQTRGGFTGRRVDIDLKDADIHNVLRLLADVGRVNIISADNVSGSVTIRMRNVPWDQALDVVLQAKGLGKEQRGNIIRVAPLADLEKEREMAIARKMQELQLAPLETRIIPVSYAQAGTVQERARELLSGRGSIAVDERTNVMIVRDVAGNLDQIEELTRSLDTQTPQVLIEARIVEATSRYLRDVGIQWGGDASFSPSTGNPTGLAFPNSIGIAGGASDNDTPTAGLSPFQNQVPNPNFAVNLPAAVGTGSGGALGLTFGSVDNNFNLAVRLSAAESSGMLRILSSPRVLTLDNTQARISQGTLIPFSQVSAQGVQTTFQEAKLQLLVEPHVTADGSVSMHVKINRDEPDFNQTSPRGDPTILKREAETELLVMDGHTAVIGGIFTRNTGRNHDQVPFFGDIPLLGIFFQQRSSSDSRGELVIFLTPRIVNRAEALGR
jgi:type IV pilus assembly protein PilQ